MALFFSWEVADDIGCARASRVLCYFLCKACQRLIYRQRNSKNYFDYTKLAFLWILHSRNYLVSTLLQPSCVHSSASSSSKHLLGCGFFKVDRQHHMNTYCRTDAYKVECPRSLHFKTMWAGKKSFKDFQDRPNVWVPAMLETPGNNLGPSDVKFFTWWTTLHAWQVHMNVNTYPTPPPTPTQQNATAT